VFGAIAGLLLAFGVFCLVQLVLFRNGAVLLNIHRAAADVKPSDILTMTATALGGLAIGGVAVMQLRKHKWEEYQAKLDEDAKTGERLSKAIEHLGDVKHKHVRIGAVYEFKNLAEDSPRNRENIVQILTQYIKSRTRVIKLDEELSQVVEVAAKVLNQLTQNIIEETSQKSNAKNRLRPPQCVFDAVEALGNCGVSNEKYAFDWKMWWKLKADNLNLIGICLKDFHLQEADFRGTKLMRARLEGAYLCGVQTNDETSINHAFTNDQTIFDKKPKMVSNVIVDNNFPK